MLWHQFLSDYTVWGGTRKAVHVVFLLKWWWVFRAFRPDCLLFCFSLLAESREGKCPVVSDDLGGSCHSRTSSYASQQSKLSGKGQPRFRKEIILVPVSCSLPNKDGWLSFWPFFNVNIVVQTGLDSDRQLVVTSLYYTALIFCSTTVILLEIMCVRSNRAKRSTKEKGSDKIIFLFSTRAAQTWGSSFH